jgi:hypothetical protein
LAGIKELVSYIASRHNPMQNSLQINDQLTRKDLFGAFKLQLAKDFEQSNFDAAFAKALEPHYASIHKQLMHELKRNEKGADANLMQLLYRIDISEMQLKKYIGEAADENHFSAIAELIIKRVLQKVVIKQYYKSNENG